jgi:hypothetical protein
LVYSFLSNGHFTITYTSFLSSLGIYRWRCLCHCCHVNDIWATIERHILIFYSDWINTKVKCFFFHYLPLAIVSIYPMIFYDLIFFILPCDIEFDYTLPTCNYYTCISWNSSLSFWDSIINCLLPACIIVIFSVARLVQVLYRRRRLHRRIEWRNYRTMTVQLLSISMIYFIFLIPPMTINTAYSIGLPWDGGSNFYWASMYFGNYTVLLIPFVCIFSLPELRRKLTVLFIFRQQNVVAPIATITINRNGTQALSSRAFER